MGSTANLRRMLIERAGLDPDAHQLPSDKQIMEMALIKTAAPNMTQEEVGRFIDAKRRMGLAEVPVHKLTLEQKMQLVLATGNQQVAVFLSQVVSPGR